jgi:hypothetical protein
MNDTDSSTIGTRGALATGVQQVTLATTVAGNTVNFRTGSIENGIATGTDLDFSKVTVTRALAAGSSLELSLKDVDTSASASTETFEAQLSVKF